MEPTITIENVVASTRLAEEFNLQKLMETGLKGAEYDQTKFPASYIELRIQRLPF